MTERFGFRGFEVPAYFFSPFLSAFFVLFFALVFTSWFFRFLLSSSQEAEVWDIPVVPVIDNGLSSFIISLVVL